MQNSNFWHKLHLHRQKITLAVLFVLVFTGLSANAQQGRTTNLPNYDNKLLHYGFQIGIHSSSLMLDYDESFADLENPELGGIRAIMAPNMPGFSLGFILNMRLADQLDLRFLPRVAFHEYKLDYKYAAGVAQDMQLQPKVINRTNVVFPLLFKYKSMRRGNTRMYLTAGASYSVNATHEKLKEEELALFLNKNDISLEAGIGLDQYFPLFKFSPEIRYSYGLTNYLARKDNVFHNGIDRLNTHSVTLYLNFE